MRDRYDHCEEVRKKRKQQVEKKKALRENWFKKRQKDGY